MRNYGLHLPPIFFKVIPHLKDKPPYFNPVITDAQWLPDIQYSDIKHDMLMESNFKSVLNDDMVEETGSGKSMKSESETNVAFSSKSTNEKMDGGRKIGFDNDREVLSDADRSSSVILPAVAEDDTQAAREEMAYLAYENTKLMRMVADLEKKLEIATVLIFAISFTKFIYCYLLFTGS